MLQHFNLEIFTYNVKTTSLFKTAPLKVSALSSEFILALFRHQRSSHTSWHLPSCIVWCSLSYRDTGGRQHCPAAPWQYEVRQGRSWEQTHKKKKKNPTTTWPRDSCTLRAPEGPTILNHCVITEIRGSRGRSISDRWRLHMHGWGGAEEESRLEQSSCKLKQLVSNLPNVPYVFPCLGAFHKSRLRPDMSPHTLSW